MKRIACISSFTPCKKRIINVSSFCHQQVLCFMENKNITFCGNKHLQKNKTEAHENLLALTKKAQRYWMNFKIQYQKVGR